MTVTRVPTTHAILSRDVFSQTTRWSAMMVTPVQITMFAVAEFALVRQSRATTATSVRPIRATLRRDVCLRTTLLCVMTAIRVHQAINAPVELVFPRVLIRRVFHQMQFARYLVPRDRQ